MADRQPYAEQCTRVYTRSGRVAHLLPPIETMRAGRPLCPAGQQEWQWEGWHGTGSQNEIDRAASLPLCRRCEDQARREDAYYSEPPQFTDPTASALAPVAPPGAARASEPGGPATPTPQGVAGGKTPGPETARPGPAAVRARAETPAGASGTDSPPAGSTGKEWRDRVKVAQSAHNAGKRRGRVRRAPKQAGPGMIRRPAPETPDGAA